MVVAVRAFLSLDRSKKERGKELVRRKCKTIALPSLYPSFFLQEKGAPSSFPSPPDKQRQKRGGRKRRKKGDPAKAAEKKEEEAKEKSCGMEEAEEGKKKKERTPLLFSCPYPSPDDRPKVVSMVLKPSSSPSSPLAALLDV